VLPQAVPLDQFAHAPLASHAPVVPQVADAFTTHPGSVVPCLTGPHCPSAPLSLSAAAHAWQDPVHAESQQNPSTQNVVAAHSFVTEQMAPRDLRGTHLPATASQ
jgi:hypothetical protein